MARVPLDLGSYDGEAPLDRASALDGRFYSGNDVAAAEARELFAKTWQLAARAQSVARPGQWVGTVVGGEPVIVARDANGQLGAFSAVCRHRAGPVAVGEGCSKVLTCAYHGWSYDLAGQLLATPEFDGVKDFDRARVALPRFAVTEWGPLVLVNLDTSAPPLADFTGDLGQRLDDLGWRTMPHSRRVSYTLECDWKVYVENYLEGYHIPRVHPGLNRVLDYSSYRTELYPWHSLQISPTRPSSDPIARYTGDSAFYAWLFPNLMLNVYEKVFSTNLIVPAGPGRTHTHFEFFFRPDEEGAVDPAYVDESVAASHLIQVEDIAICEAVQRGLSSTRYVPGRLSARRENGVHHFQQLWARWMGARGNTP